MKKHLRTLLILFASLCLASGLAPMVYGILHVGMIALILYGAGLLALLLFHKQLRCFLCRALAAGLAAFTVFGAGMSVWMLSYAYFTPPPPDATVIVLGCQVLGDQPSRMLQLRIDAAYAYLSAHPTAHAIGTGGADPQEWSEAAVIEKVLLEKGIDPARIYQEPHSRSTAENLRFAARIIEAEGLSRNVAIATDGFHQLRGAIYARRAGLEPAALPAPTPWGLFPGYWVREWFGIAKALMID